MKKNSLHSHMVGASRERKSLSGAIKVAKINTPENNAFWREVRDMCGLNKADVTPAYIVEHGTDKELKTNKGENRTQWSDWFVKKIVRRYAIQNS